MDLAIINNVRKKLSQKPTEKLRKIYDRKSGWRSPEAFVAIHQILVERGETVADLPVEIKATFEATRDPGAAQEQPPPSSASDDPIRPSEIREFIRNVNRAHDDQLRILSAIRWAIVGFSIWFIIQFWFLPKLLLSTR